MSDWERGEVSVRWLQGGLSVRVGADVWVVDAPTGVVDALGDEAARVRGVVISHGRMPAVGGLLPLLDALHGHVSEDVPLEVRVPLGDERPALLADAWSRGWPGRTPLVLDAEAPGMASELGPLMLERVQFRGGEPVQGEIRPLAVDGLKIGLGSLTIAWLPCVAPSTRLDRFFVGVDLAVVTVGAAPWPRSEERVRLSLAEAVAASAAAETVWIVTDEGSWAGTAEA